MIFPDESILVTAPLTCCLTPGVQFNLVSQPLPLLNILTVSSEVLIEFFLCGTC
jgi:hypothetical protein